MLKTLKSIIKSVDVIRKSFICTLIFVYIKKRMLGFYGKYFFIDELELESIENLFLKEAEAMSHQLFYVNGTKKQYPIKHVINNFVIEVLFILIFIFYEIDKILQVFFMI